MDNLNNTEPRGMTDEEIAALEEERRQEEEARLAPYRQAAQERKESAVIIAEHDELIAEAIYDLAIMKIRGV